MAVIALLIGSDSHWTLLLSLIRFDGDKTKKPKINKIGGRCWPEKKKNWAKQWGVNGIDVSRRVARSCKCSKFHVSNDKLNNDT